MKTLPISLKKRNEVTNEYIEQYYPFEVPVLWEGENIFVHNPVTRFDKSQKLDKFEWCITHKSTGLKAHWGGFEKLEHAIRRAKEIDQHEYIIACNAFGFSQMPNIRPTEEQKKELFRY